MKKIFVATMVVAVLLVLSVISTAQTTNTQSINQSGPDSNSPVDSNSNVSTNIQAGELTNKQSNRPDCVRWTWTGDVYNRKVICVEWRKQEEEGSKKK